MSGRRILVLGATGAVGRPLCARLRSTGHDVYGSYRSSDGARLLEGLRCTPVAMDVFDAQAVGRALEDVRPQVIVHQLTALPKVPKPKAMAEGVAATGELRRRTVPLFAEHARRLGARFIAQTSRS